MLGAGDGFSAVELTLRPGPSLLLRTIQMSPAGAAIRHRADAYGRIAVTIASARPLNRARIVAVFDGRGRIGLARQSHRRG